MSSSIVAVAGVCGVVVRVGAEWVAVRDCPMRGVAGCAELAAMELPGVTALEPGEREWADGDVTKPKLEAAAGSSLFVAMYSGSPGYRKLIDMPIAARLLPQSELRSVAAGADLELQPCLCCNRASAPAPAVEATALATDGAEATEMLPPATTELLDASARPGLFPSVCVGFFLGDVAREGTMPILSPAAAAAAAMDTVTRGRRWHVTAGCEVGRGNSGPLREILSDCRPTTEMLIALLDSPSMLGSAL